jgi:hypothetical protein
MPDLKDIISTRDKKKFVKNAYRPWDLTGTNSDETYEKKINAVKEEKPKGIKKNNEPLNESKNTASHQLNNNIIPNTQKLSDEKSPEEVNNETDVASDNGIPGKPDRVSYKSRSGLKDDITPSEVNPISIELKIRNLAGLQKKILNIITKACSENDLKTGPIHTKVLAENINASIGSTKMSISRLITKGLISREKGRPAKDGFLNLRINKETYEVLLRLKERETPL